MIFKKNLCRDTTIKNLCDRKHEHRKRIILTLLILMLNSSVSAHLRNCVLVNFSDSTRVTRLALILSPECKKLIHFETIEFPETFLGVLLALSSHHETQISRHIHVQSLVAIRRTGFYGLV